MLKLRLINEVFLGLVYRRMILVSWVHEAADAWNVSLTVLLLVDRKLLVSVVCGVKVTVRNVLLSCSLLRVLVNREKLLS